MFGQSPPHIRCGDPVRGPFASVFCSPPPIRNLRAAMVPFSSAFRFSIALQEIQSRDPLHDSGSSDHVLVCNCIRIRRASFTNCFPVPVNSSAPSVTKRLVISTSSVKHRWDLTVLHYHKIMVIYPHPFLVVINQLFACIIFINDCICILSGSTG